MRARTIIGVAAALALASACSSEDGSSGEGADDFPGASCNEMTVGEPDLRRLTAQELQNTLEDMLPEAQAHWQSVRLGPDPVSSDGFSNDTAMLVMSEQTTKDWLATAEDVANALTQTDVLPTVLPCATTTADAICAASFIDKYGYRLFHRTLTDSETARYGALHASVSTQSDFATGIKWVLVSLIQSPHAVYRSEIGVWQGDRFVLQPHEIATALAYTYTGTAPNEVLLSRAENGELDGAEQRSALARKLLDTSRGRQTVHRFVDEWLDYSRVGGGSKEGVSEFAAASEPMVLETEAFLDEVLYQQEGGVDDLLTAPYTMLNDTLSEYYGYGQVTGSEFARVARPDDWGVGLLAQGSVLSSHAHTDSSSPTLRGIMVYERWLCQTMPAPPADIPPIDPPAPGEVTTRQRYEQQHLQSAACKSCHQYTDPTGFAFEHFDAAGRFRADENGLPVDSAGSVPLASGRQEIEGQIELAAALAASEQTHACVSSLVANYAFGGNHGGVQDGVCAISGPQRRLVDGEIGLLQYWAELASTPHFTERQISAQR